MAKHKRWAKKEWVWLFLSGYRPPDYSFEVHRLEHARPKHLVLYQELLANERREYFDALEVEDGEPVPDAPSIG